MAYKQISPIPIAQGGTNATYFTYNFGVLYIADGSLLDINPSGTDGQFLQSQGSSNAPQWASLTPAAPVANYVTVTEYQLTPNASFQMSAGSSMILAVLPTTASFGSRIDIIGFDPGLWTVACNEGQIINFGAISTIPGGSLSSTGQYDAITLFSLC